MTDTVFFAIVCLVCCAALCGCWIYSKRLDKQIAEMDKERSENDKKTETDRLVTENEKRAVLELQLSVLKRYEEMDSEQIEAIQNNLNALVSIEKSKQFYQPYSVFPVVSYYPYQGFRPYW